MAAFLLFASNLWIETTSIEKHFIFITVLTLFFCLLCSCVLERRFFKIMIKLWLLGSIIYLCFAIPRIYLGGTLTPYLNLHSLQARWLYSLLLPLLLLGTFSSGLTFMSITSPTEFLSYGPIGMKIALLFRALQHAMQTLQETKIALMMQNQWPEEGKGLIRLRETWMCIKYSPLLVSTTLRNIILYWFPWGYLCFNQLQKKINNEKILQRENDNAEY